ncbi:MAG: endonuclease III [Deltaproteobacteria bacterium]|nr:MAG: endonuclease III [Deltaproteobacteria bacterium]
MTRAEKARRIARILDRLHPDAAIPLDHVDPYTLLVAVVLSAQCTDERVNQVTPALFARAATPDAMAKLSVAEIERMIRSCGLAPAKAKAIHGLSVLVRDQYGGRVPADIEKLEALPGVGHKTASVVMVQAFGVPAFPVDTHIHRLAGRWGLSRAKNVAMVERDLKALFPPEDWGNVHLQIILFGRAHCPARGHDLRACPICSWAASKARIAREMGTRGGARPSVMRADSRRGPSRPHPSGVRRDRRSSSRT